MTGIVSQGAVQKKKRRPHTRASKACTHCRQQKTRCLRSENSVACLRCTSLNLKCSFLDEIEHSHEHNTSSSPATSMQQTSQQQPAQQQPENETNQTAQITDQPPQQQQLQQPKQISSFLPSKSISPQLQAQMPPGYDFSPQLLPSINSPLTNMLYDRTQSPNSQYTQKNIPNNIVNKQTESISQLLTGTSPRLTQPFTPNFNPDLEVETKLDSIFHDVKQILSSIHGTPTESVHSTSNNLTSSVPAPISTTPTATINSVSKPMYTETEVMPMMTEPINTTNIATQYHLFSPINFMKLITEQENTHIMNQNSMRSASSGSIDTTALNTPTVRLPLSIQQQLYPLHTFRLKYQDIITMGILTVDQAVQLLDIFRDRYGRWVSFPTMASTKKLLRRFRNRCPLLLTISCLLSLKYGDPLLKQKIWSKLVSIVRKEVHWLSSTYSGSLEELQCLVILSAYCIGLSDSSFQNDEINGNNEEEAPLLLLDGWHLSGTALTLFEKINGYGILDQMYGDEIESLWVNNKEKIEKKLGKDSSNSNVEYLISDGNTGVEEDEEYDYDEFNLLTLHRIWNTLVLIHMAYCLLDGRKSWIGLDKLKPRDISGLTNATNFDFRIIAEIHMYLIGYKYVMLNGNYEETLQYMKLWLEKWNTTFSQPSNQFVEMDYHFVEILIKIKQLKLDLISLQFLQNSEIDLKEIVNIKMHSNAILNLINTVNDDSYFAFLSDQIHLTIFYSTNVLISVLYALDKINQNQNGENAIETLDNSIKEKIEKLIFRYRTVATTKSDTFYKYYNILQHIYNTKLKSQ